MGSVDEKENNNRAIPDLCIGYSGKDLICRELSDQDCVIFHVLMFVSE